MLAYPVTAHAGVLSSFKEKVKAVFLPSSENLLAEESATSQTMPVFKPVVVDEDEDLETVSSSSEGVLSATMGPLRVSTEDIDFPTDDTISVYEVKKGDTLATIAKLFGVSKNTIMWANDLKSEKLTPGDTLLILPITGVRHVAKNGDTISSIARKYKGDASDISKYNGLALDAKLAAGDVVIVPEGEIAVAPTKKIIKTPAVSTPSGFLVRPLVGGRKTQGIHGHNAVDIAANVGTPIVAAASGKVIVARSSGYNGGYGNMVIITHANNVQTVYAHMNTVNVVTGQTVVQGESLGSVGNTGRSTGPHLHFEVRGAKNPF